MKAPLMFSFIKKEQIQLRVVLFMLLIVTGYNYAYIFAV